MSENSQRTIKELSDFYRRRDREGLSNTVIQQFRKAIYQHYKNNRRELPWRNTDNPYHILVSEIMLQQTQVERVFVKYEQFISAFPDFLSLAKAPLRNILLLWQGLGYNRRAKALKETAQRIVKEYNGTLPSSVDDLTTLPGIGRATASAIVAFAFHQPAVFIETNIRRVFIHFFFQDKENINDRDILLIVEKTLDRADPREWYYALMDYGTLLKKEYVNPNRRSAHYQKQSLFQGSNRQIRGMIVRTLLQKPELSQQEIIKSIGSSPERVRDIIRQLQKEGFIKKKKRGFAIA